MAQGKMGSDDQNCPIKSIYTEMNVNFFFLSYSHSREEPINKRKQVVARLFLACLSGSHLSLGQWNFIDRNRLAVNSYLLFTFFFTVVTKPMRPIQGVTKKIRDATYSCKNNNKIGISGRKEKENEKERKDPPNQCPFRVDETRFHQHMQSQPIEWHT